MLTFSALALRQVLLGLFSNFQRSHSLNSFLNKSDLHFSFSYLTLIYLVSIHKLMFIITAWKVSKYGVYSGPYFSVFSTNKGKYRLLETPYLGKYRPEKTPYLDTFHIVNTISNRKICILVFSALFSLKKFH